MSATRKPDTESHLQSSTTFLRNYFRQATLEVGPENKGATEYMHKKVKSEIRKLKEKRNRSKEKLARTNEAVKKQVPHQDQHTDNEHGNQTTSKRVKRSLSFYQAKQAFYENKLRSIGDDIEQMKMADITLERALGKY